MNNTKEEFMERIPEFCQRIYIPADDADRDDLFRSAYEKAVELGCAEEFSTEFWTVYKELTAPKYRSFSDIQSTETEWLWYPYIPRGKIVLMTAPPGTGKTFLSLYLCAALSDGRSFMGEDESKVRSPEKSVYQTAEDGIADTLKRRLEMISPQPDYSQIFNINESEKGIVLSDVERIEEALRSIRPALVIFDPLQAYLGSDVDMHRANEVRPVMSRLGTLAEKYNCTFLFIMHNSKMQQGNALYASLGSVDIPAVSRSMLMLDKHPEEEGKLILCHVKSSLASHGKSVVFHIEQGDVVFDGFSHLGAEDVYFAKKKSSGRNSEELERVVEVLNDALDRHRGFIPLAEVKALQEEYHISRPTMYRAKQELELKDITIGYSGKRVSYWIVKEMDKEAFKADRIKRKSHDNPYL